MNVYKLRGIAMMFKRRMGCGSKQVQLINENITHWTMKQSLFFENWTFANHLPKNF